MNDVRGFYNCSIHPGNINVWYEPLTKSGRHYKPETDSDEIDEINSHIPTQFKDNYHHGLISPVAKKKITRAIDYLVYLSPKKKFSHPYYDRSRPFILNFITLTLSSEQIHSDNEIKSCILEPFLNTCRQKWKITHYVWRAEKQKNGSIHFHIIANRFIPWNELRNCWNLHQQKLGYVTRYRDNQIAWHREGFKYRPELEKSWPRSKQLQAYKDGILHDWNNPNSTDVHSLRFISDVRSYFVKYITKTAQSENITGRLWGCSYNLTDIKGARSFCEGSVSDEINTLVNTPGVTKFTGEYYTALYFDSKILYSGSFPELCSFFEQFLTDTFPDYRPPSLL